MPAPIRLLEDPPPLLRGWLHLVCAVAAIPAGVLVVAHADRGRARTGALVYAAGVCVLFAASAIYHRVRWSERVRPWMKRVDHAGIFVMIAASYTPLCLVTLREGSGAWLLAGAWTGAVIGVVGAITGYAERRILGLVAYSALGWLAVLAFPELAGHLSRRDFVLLVVGGVVYSLGSIGLGTRWPNPSPRVFGYHEVWHVLVVIAVVCHFSVIWSVVG